MPRNARIHGDSRAISAYRGVSAAATVRARASTDKMHAVSRKQFAMDETIDAFEHAIGELALQIVRAVLTDEIQQRLASAPAVPAMEEVEPVRESAAAPPAAPPAPGGRTVWTRESVIEELATWLLTSPSIEASFITRHGKPGLVGNAKKIFGRFDAALNAANLHIAQKYPDGPPSRTSLPVTRG